jgi:hypothetical protein
MQNWRLSPKAQTCSLRPQKHFRWIFNPVSTDSIRQFSPRTPTSMSGSGRPRRRQRTPLVPYEYRPLHHDSSKFRISKTCSGRPAAHTAVNKIVCHREQEADVKFSTVKADDDRFGKFDALFGSANGSGGRKETWDVHDWSKHKPDTETV